MTPATPISWVEKGLDTAEFFANRFSKDPSTKVAAVIMNRRHRFIALGYNGFPDRIPDDPQRLLDRDAKLADTIHAEVNAVLNAVASVEGGVMFVTHPPCGDCAPFIVQAGIVEVHYRAPEKGSTFSERWKCSVERGSDCFRRAGVPVFGWNRFSNPVELVERLGSA